MTAGRPLSRAKSVVVTRFGSVTFHPEAAESRTPKKSVMTVETGAGTAAIVVTA